MARSRRASASGVGERGATAVAPLGNSNRPSNAAPSRKHAEAPLHKPTAAAVPAYGLPAAAGRHAAAHRRPAADSPPSPPLPAAAEALLPGLDEDGPPGVCQLPLAASDGEASAYGAALGGTMRVTSITRSAAARRVGALRLVMQPDAAEGRRLSRKPPQERLAIRARTVPLQQAQQGPRRTAPAAPAPGAQVEVAEQGAGDGQQQTAACSSGTPTAAAEASGAAEPAGTRLPAPLPLQPGAAAASSCSGSTTSAAANDSDSTEGEEQAEAAAAAEEWSEEVDSAAAAVYTGVPAEEEAAALPSAPPAPAWLLQQGSCRNEPGCHTSASPAGPHLPDRQHAAAMWRMQWLSGLQWHNAVRAGHPIKSCSQWSFIPLDPNEPLLDLFMFRTAVMPEHVIAGAARFEDILLGDPPLHAAAMEAGVFSVGVWGVPAADGSGAYHLVQGGCQMALPVSLRCAPPPTVALFLACVWHEANRAETAQHATYSFGAGGERVADPRGLKYPIAELHEWVRMAVGCGKRAAEEVLTSTLSHLACFGTE